MKCSCAQCAVKAKHMFQYHLCMASPFEYKFLSATNSTYIISTNSTNQSNLDGHGHASTIIDMRIFFELGIVNKWASFCTRFVEDAGLLVINWAIYWPHFILGQPTIMQQTARKWRNRLLMNHLQKYSVTKTNARKHLHMSYHTLPALHATVAMQSVAWKSKDI